MYKILLSLLIFLMISDVYSFTSPALNGGSDIHFSDFRGKKILIVNTASTGAMAGQYARLEQLYEQYRDSLVIVAFPSNDFGHEPGSEQAIQDSLQNLYHVQFPVASKTVVSGDGQCALFQWLTQGSQNGVMNSTISNDFQKYLIGSDGHLIGYFIGAMDPLDSTITNLISGQ